MLYAITRDFFSPVVVEYPSACIQLTSASLYHLVLLVIDRTTPTREYTVLIGDPIAVQILTHNPSLSSVWQYPHAFELPRAEARHHQPDLPRAPTPRAFARVGCLSITNHPHIRYRTYLVLLFNTTGEEILVLSVQPHYTWLLGISVTFCFKGVLAQWTQSNACVACFLSLAMPQNVSREGDGRHAKFA